MSESSVLLVYSPLIHKTFEEIKKWDKEHNIPQDHGYDHAIKVFHNAYSALGDFELNPTQQLIVLLAALLHDLEDRKYVKTSNYEGTLNLLEQIGFTKQFGTENTELIITLIKLVSCFANGMIIDEKLPKWYYIPRDADRLEALGYVGIKRCAETTVYFGLKQNKPPNYYNENTARCTTEKELETTATKERFQAYMGIGFSNSMIDHYYDKLLHIHELSSGSKVLQDMANSRRQIMIDFVLEFGQTGKINWEKWNR